MLYNGLKQHHTSRKCDRITKQHKHIENILQADIAVYRLKRGCNHTFNIAANKFKDMNNLEFNW